MTCIVCCWDVGHSRMSLARVQKSIGSGREPWCVAWTQKKLYCNYMETGMVSHLLYSSLGLQLGCENYMFFFSEIGL